MGASTRDETASSGTAGPVQKHMSDLRGLREWVAASLVVVRVKYVHVCVCVSMSCAACACVGGRQTMWTQTCEVLDLLRHVADEPMTIGARHHLLAIRKVLLRRCGPLAQYHLIDGNLCRGGSASQ